MELTQENRMTGKHVKREESNEPFNGMSDGYRKRLWGVMAINAGMFAVEVTAGNVADSQALLADSLDFFGDSLTYAISLAVIGASLQTRSNVAILKGVSLLLMGVWVLGSTAVQFFNSSVPQAEVMGSIGVLALLANVVSAFLLLSYREGDANIRSAWLCTRNDAIGNIAVVIAAFGVWGTNAALPDLIVGAIMAGLFLSSSVQIISQAVAEKRSARSR